MRAQPEQFVGFGIGQPLFDVLGGVHRLLREAGKEAAEKTADIAATGNCRQEINLPEQFVAGQGLENAEVEGRTADAASG